MRRKVRLRMKQEEPNSSNIQGDPDGLFDGSVRPVLAAEKKRLSRGVVVAVRESAGGATMLLGCMHQEWMAQVDGAVSPVVSTSCRGAVYSKTHLREDIGMENDKLALVAAYGSRAEALLAKSARESAGIRAMVEADSAGRMRKHLA